MTKKKFIPTKIMGVLNVTPDSFFDGGKYYHNKTALIDRVSQMIKGGADIIDVGGESTRPGAVEVSVDEELSRVIPAIETIISQFGDEICISVDTYKSKVAFEAIQKGATIINDISGLQFDSGMPTLIASSGCQIIINHIKGKPRDMQTGKLVYEDIISDLLTFFTNKTSLLNTRGVTDDKIILDPGFGFGKTWLQNIDILKRLKELSILKFPLLIGVSRKSTIGIILNKALKLDGTMDLEDRLEGSLAASAIAVMNGAKIIRTHDVSQTKKFINVFEYIYNL